MKNNITLRILGENISKWGVTWQFIIRNNLVWILPVHIAVNAHTVQAPVKLFHFEFGSVLHVVLCHINRQQQSRVSPTLMHTTGTLQESDDGIISTAVDHVKQKQPKTTKSTLRNILVLPAIIKCCAVPPQYCVHVQLFQFNPFQILIQKTQLLSKM